MTDKEQIIITGVDVSECEFFDGSHLGQCDKTIIDEHKKLKNIFSVKYVNCRDNYNCYFKQLARKTQECEQKEKELLSNEKIINKLMKEVDELKQECEKLKNQVDEDYNYYTTESKTLRDIISNKEKRNAALFLMSNRYRKALDEIEYYCNKQISLTGDLPFRTTESDILDIINKVKGGNNAR